MSKLARDKISQSQIKEVLRYDPETGVFTWRPRKTEQFGGLNPSRDMKKWNACYANTTAGGVGSAGYRFITVYDIPYLASRLACLHMTGSFPDDCMDHINHIKDDDRWCNLREVTRAENNRNLAMRKSNKSGVTGVHWYSPSQVWRANIRIKGKLKHLGCFADIKNAAAARKIAERKYGFHENHGL